jgi:glycosyltransferase involved in cell wall biosynthesis
MNILFLIYHGFSKTSGISKKIYYQINGLRSLGHQVHVCSYDFASDGSRVRLIHSHIIENYGKGELAAIRKRISYGAIIRFAIDNHIDFVYARSFHNANPFTINMFHQFRKHNIKSVIEIPTYPYDQEYLGYSMKDQVELKMDQLFRKRLAKETDAIVTFTDDRSIFGQKTICISNGVEFESIRLKNSKNNSSDEINFIGVAEVHYWHGFDRMISGIGEYYLHGGKRNMFFHIIGGVDDGEMYGSAHAKGFLALVKKYEIKDRIIFHGKMFGKGLDDMFEKCDFAIGSLARHRSGISNIKTLKNREYAARGIPFVYSETDSDFDNMPYIIKVPADESAINIQNIIAFYDSLNMKPTDIRATIGHLSWREQMKKVIKFI